MSALQEWLDQHYINSGGYDKFLEMNRSNCRAKDIAKHFNVAPGVISNWRRTHHRETGENFSPVRFSKGVNLEGFRHNFNRLYGHLGGCDKFLEMINDGYKVGDIAQYFGCKPFAVYTYVWKIGGGSLLTLRKSHAREQMSIPEVSIQIVNHLHCFDKHEQFGGLQGIIDMLVNNVSISEVAKMLGVSRQWVSDVFYRVTGCFYRDMRRSASLKKKHDALLRERICSDCGQPFLVGNPRVPRCPKCHLVRRHMQEVVSNRRSLERRKVLVS